MEILDVGELAGPVLLFGGVYGNLQALEAVLAQAKALGAVPVCTGDVVAYCADGEACVALMRREGVASIAGNCERNLAIGAADCGCGFEEGTTCEQLSAAWFAHAQATVSQSGLDWMRQLPDRIVFTHHGQRYAVLHGAVDDIAGFLWPGSVHIQSQIRKAEAHMGPLSGVISGHCGLAFRQGRWINAGAIGMPPNDGGTATRFAVLEKGAVRFCQLKYDHKAAQKAMNLAGLVQGYERSLCSGIWPSEDVLPRHLRRLR